jgi:chromosome segregation ATPase
MAQRNDLTRKLQGLEVEMASMDARRQAIAREIERIRQEAEAKLANDPVTRQLQDIVQANGEYLGRIKNEVEAGRALTSALAEANEKLTRAKIDLAKRQEELAREVGGGQLEKFTGEMVRMTVDNAEKQAQMGVLRRQLDQTQTQLARAPRVDPDAAKTRAMQEAIEVMDRPIADLHIRIATLQAPTVTVIGGD